MFNSRYKIKNVIAREILDSRGQPTIECQVTLNDNSMAVASVPSGASVGKYEALELRDQDSARYHGRGVLKAVSNIQSIIAPLLIGKDVRRQKEIDQIMMRVDNTDNKARLGANAILGVSLASARAASKAQNLELYLWLEKLLLKI